MLQQQHLLKQHLQSHQIVVERSCNPPSIVTGFGKTPQEAVQQVLDNARAYGYWDVTMAYPKAQAPSEPGTEKGSPRDDR
ncbi:hypothetical protein QUB05_07535 [Microcoleus sp. F10-C6]|uniref:hypothetical protein n=1 Tax=unclassified Microcoleus TaxID=2642155 RepID=UPI002FCFEA48